MTESDMNSHPTLGPWIRNSLKVKIKELREQARVCRMQNKNNELTKDAAKFVASVYESAADEIQEQLDFIKRQ